MNEEWRQTVLRAIREALTPEELGEVLLHAVAHRRLVEAWWYQVCVLAVEGRERGFVREAAREAGLGHQLVYRHAGWAQNDTDPLYSLRAARRVP